MAEYRKYPASFETFKKVVAEGVISHKPETFSTAGTPSTPHLGWDHPESDPLADLEAILELHRMPFLLRSISKKGKRVAGELDYWTAEDIHMHPTLMHCSKCGSKRTTRVDPWITLKHCPNCGNVDEIMASPPAMPTSLSWEEVQRLLVGILRQVPDNKVQVHPAEFNTDGLVFKQETDTETGIVTIWFEKSDLPSPAVAEKCSSFTYSPVAVSGTTQLHCNKPSGHPGDHEALDSSWSTVLWPNRAHSVGVMVKCAKAMPLAGGGRAVCHQPHGHSGNHMGMDSLAHGTIAWIDETAAEGCPRQFNLVGFGTLVCQGVSGHRHHPGTQHYAKDPSSTDPSAFILWD